MPLYGWTLALLAAWVLVMAFPMRASAPEPGHAESGLLRRGRWAALQAAVVRLHAAGLVEVDTEGRLARTKRKLRSDIDGLAQAVYAAMPEPTSVLMLRIRPGVRQALGELVQRLAAHGLVQGRRRWRFSRALLVVVAVLCVRQLTGGAGTVVDAALAMVLLIAAVAAWFVPRRTVAGQRLLRQLRRQHDGMPQLIRDGDAGELTAEQVAMVHGLSGQAPAGLAGAFARAGAGSAPGDQESELEQRGGRRQRRRTRP